MPNEVKQFVVKKKGFIGDERKEVGDKITSTERAMRYHLLNGQVVIENNTPGNEKPSEKTSEKPTEKTTPKPSKSKVAN